MMEHRMNFSIRKKALFFGALLAVTAIIAPGIGRLCQAAADRSMAAHPCCQDKIKCGPQFNSQSCCESSGTAARHSTPVPQANPDPGKYFPLIASLVPSLPGLGNLSDNPFKTVASYAIPPPFLSHHAFLC